MKYYDDVYVDLEKKTCTCSYYTKDVEEFVDSYYTKEMYLKAYEFSIPPLPSEKYWPIVVKPLEPPPIKAAPVRPKKNRKKDPRELPKKPGKLSKHGVKVTCSNCKEKGHNKTSCTKPPAETSEKRKRGRPRRTAAAQESQQGGVQTTQQSTIKVALNRPNNQRVQGEEKGQEKMQQGQIEAFGLVFW